MNHLQAKSKIIYVKGKNIFESIKLRSRSKNNGSTVVVPHVCNNIGLFGAGFARAMAEQYPIVQMNFEMLGKKSKLGVSQFIVAETEPEYKHQIIVANMISQNKTISQNNPRPLNYSALVQCMNEVKLFCSRLRLNSQSVEIHAPKFGSGLAGGNWNFIENLIEDIWFDYTTFVYLYPVVKK